MRGDLNCREAERPEDFMALVAAVMTGVEGAAGEWSSNDFCFAIGGVKDALFFNMGDLKGVRTLECEFAVSSNRRRGRLG